MWGGANWNLTQTSSLRTSLITNGYKWRKNYDQIMLARTVWTAAKNDAIIHDSYLCRIFENTVPWPTQRENQSHYVGKSSGWKVHEDLQKVPECPFKCRPRDHIDWTYC